MAPRVHGPARGAGPAIVVGPRDLDRMSWYARARLARQARAGRAIIVSTPRPAPPAVLRAIEVRRLAHSGQVAAAAALLLQDIPLDAADVVQARRRDLLDAHVPSVPLTDAELAAGWTPRSVAKAASAARSGSTDLRDRDGLRVYQRAMKRRSRLRATTTGRTAA